MLLRHRPMIAPALAFMLGIVLDDWIRIPLWTSAILAAGSLAALTMPRLRKNWSWAVLLTCVALGMARHNIQFRSIPAHDLVRFAPREGARLVRVRGIIISPPIIDAPSAAHVPFDTAPRTRFDVLAQTVLQPAGASPASGTLRVAIAAPALRLGTGQQVEMLGRLRRYHDPDNPGQFDLARRRRQQGRLVTMSVDDERNVRIVAPARTGWRLVLQTVRAHFRNLLLSPARAPDDRVQSLLDSMVLAQSGRIERSLDDAFVRTGTIHFLCASGLNVVWMAGIVRALLFLLGVHHRAAALWCIAAIVAYAGLAEPNPPILRAAVTGVLFFVAQLLRRQNRSGNWLALAALVVLLINPSDLFDPGYQFSFGIVAGLVFVFPVLVTRWTAPAVTHANDSNLVIPLTDPDRPAPRLIRKYLISAVGMSVLAWLIGVPIAAYHFGRLSSLGWLNSLIMSPLVFTITSLGFIKLCITALWPSLGGLLEWPLDLLTNLLARLAMTLSHAPACNIPVTPPHGAWIIVFYAALAVFSLGTSVRRRRLAGALLVALTLTLLLPWPRLLRPANEVRLWALAVGHGSATIMECPNGRTIAFDLGSRSLGDAANSVILPFLRTRGIRSLACVVVSHPDSDHFGAIAGVAREVPIGRVLLNPHFRRFATVGSAARQFLDDMSALNIPIETLQASDRLAGAGDARIEILWPTRSAAGLPDNDTSTVVRILVHGRSILIPGDIADAAESALIARQIPRCDVLFLPHHGSTQANSLPRFIEACRPDSVIRSSGQRDRETPPRLWDAIGPRAYYNTADCGAVCIVLTPTGIRVEPWRSTNGRPRLGTD